MPFFFFSERPSLQSVAVHTQAAVGYSPKLWKDQSYIRWYVCKLARLHSSTSRLNNTVFPKHLLELSPKHCITTDLLQQIDRAFQDTGAWEHLGADAVACINNTQFTTMLNFISECFSNAVQC